jgi:hypothetical protein
VELQTVTIRPYPGVVPAPADGVACEFIDAASDLPDADKATIASIAAASDISVRSHLPLARGVRLQVGPTEHAIASTGDTAYTAGPESIFWAYAAHLDPVAVAKSHLRKAYFHEAYHAARFRRLHREAGLLRWSNIAIGEGLAVVFARDHANAIEEWCSYDPSTIRAWAVEFLNAPEDADWLRWKFRHEDGREFIAFRVGVWLVEQIQRETGKSAADLVWTPVEELEAVAIVADLLQRSL